VGRGAYRVLVGDIEEEIALGRPSMDERTVLHGS
jgi:hypothetical protein